MKLKMSIKILLVGPSAVGKTSLVTKLRTGYFTERHVSTIGSLSFHLVFKNIPLTITECNKVKCLRHIDAVMIMFDIKQPAAMAEYVKNIRKLYGSVPVCIVANKDDEQYSQREPYCNLYETVYGVKYFKVSVKYNRIKDPIDWLIRQTFIRQTNLPPIPEREEIEDAVELVSVLSLQ